MPQALTLTLIDQKLEGFKTVVDTIQEKVFETSDTVGGLKTSLGTHQTTIEAIETKVDANETAIRAVETKVDTNEGTIRTIETKVDENLTTLAGVETKVASFSVEQFREELQGIRQDMVQREVLLMRWLVGLLFSALVSVALAYGLQ